MYCTCSFLNTAYTTDYYDANASVTTVVAKPSKSCFDKLPTDALTNAAPSPSALASVPFLGRPEGDAEGLADPEAEGEGAWGVPALLEAGPSLDGERTLSMTWMSACRLVTAAHMEDPILQRHIGSQHGGFDVSKRNCRDLATGIMCDK